MSELVVPIWKGPDVVDMDREFIVADTGDLVLILTGLEIAKLTNADRHEYLGYLKAYDAANDTDYMAEWRTFFTRCSYVDPDTLQQCTRSQWYDSNQCLDHLTPSDSVLAEIRANQEAVKAKIRLAHMLPQAVDALQEVLDSEVETAKLKAIENIFDRAGVPKRHDTVSDVSVTTDQGDMDDLRRKLDNLAEAFPGTAAVVDSPPSVIDAEEVE